MTNAIAPKCDLASTASQMCSVQTQQTQQSNVCAPVAAVDAWESSPQSNSVAQERSAFKAPVGRRIRMPKYSAVVQAYQKKIADLKRVEALEIDCGKSDGIDYKATQKGVDAFARRFGGIARGARITDVEVQRAIDREWERVFSRPAVKTTPASNIDSAEKRDIAEMTLGKRALSAELKAEVDAGRGSSAKAADLAARIHKIDRLIGRYRAAAMSDAPQAHSSWMPGPPTPRPAKAVVEKKP